MPIQRPPIHDLTQTEFDAIDKLVMYSAYEEALIHLLGGGNECLRRIELHRDGNLLGTHLIAMHSSEHFFVVTAISREAKNAASWPGLLPQ